MMMYTFRPPVYRSAREEEVVRAGAPPAMMGDGGVGVGG